MHLIILHIPILEPTASNSHWDLGSHSCMENRAQHYLKHLIFKSGPWTIKIMGAKTDLWRYQISQNDDLKETLQLGWTGTVHMPGLVWEMCKIWANFTIKHAAPLVVNFLYNSLMMHPWLSSSLQMALHNWFCSQPVQ